MPSLPHAVDAVHLPTSRPPTSSDRAPPTRSPTECPNSADALRSTAADLAERPAEALSSAAPAAASALASAAASAIGGGPENVEKLARRLYGPLVRRLKAELLLDRERRGIRIDGI